MAYRLLYTVFFIIYCKAAAAIMMRMMKWGGTNNETNKIPMLLWQLGLIIFGSSINVVTAFSSSTTQYRYSSSSFSQGRTLFIPRLLVEPSSIFSKNNGPVSSRFMALGMKTSDDDNNKNDDNNDEGQEKDGLMPSFLVKTSLSELLDYNEGKEARPGSLAAATREMGRVPYGEASRKYRRTVFSHNDWVQHRSNTRLTRNLKGMLVSGIVRQLQSELALVTILSSFVLTWNDIIVPGVSDISIIHDTFLMTLPMLQLPSLPFTLASPALGLLLVFRTNASYGRWTEARMTWGKIMTQSRNLVRMSCTFVLNPNAQISTNSGTNWNNGELQSLDRLTKVTWAFSRSLMNQLSGPEDDDGPYEEQLRSVFLETTHNENNENEDLQYGRNFVSRILACDEKSRALAALTELSLLLDALPVVTEKNRVEIDKSLVLMGDSLGACERIYTAPVPLVYTRHTARFLTFYLICLPMALYTPFSSLNKAAATATTVPGFHMSSLSLIPAMALLALFLFGIEELAIQLEEPFSILPMEKFCDGIRKTTTGIKDWTVESCAFSASNNNSNNCNNNNGVVAPTSKVLTTPPPTTK
uniref:Bestrophin homolog n=1 Tax=Attheya septentrionalis TaxID=420275 RepID=A0A7S2UDK8_9STRA|mmetsp:Transcript_19385/g.35215  ORF Transcript_19385/g.35215 Transcript_19385/m.35215 type:complete len:585 (+) Transcript_19385:215-1969(+)